MNLNVEHVLMFTLVVCALYYLMGRCSVEGFGEQFCENALKRCLCKGQKKTQPCINSVNNMVVPGSNNTCMNIGWNVDEAHDIGLGSWFGKPPICEGECPDEWTNCETSNTECLWGHKVRCANLS